MSDLTYFEKKTKEIDISCTIVYVDEAAFEAHLATPHARRAMEGSKTWAEGPFDVTRAESIYPHSNSAFGTVMEEG